MPENGPGRARVKPKLAISARSSGRSITARPPLPRQSRLMRPMQLTPKGFGRQRDRKGQPRDTAARESSSGPERRDPMKIDIDRMTEAELIDLNHRIVARLRFLNQMRAHSEMLEFRIGDRVAFRPSGQGRVEGLLTRYNKKTVTVITDDGRQWNVSPNLLSRVVSPETASPGGADVVLLGKR